MDHAMLGPNWLTEELSEAASDWALSVAPERSDRPLADEDARRLREKMAARYAAWTGGDLVADLRGEARKAPWTKPRAEQNPSPLKPCPEEPEHLCCYPACNCAPHRVPA